MDDLFNVESHLKARWRPAEAALEDAQNAEVGRRKAILSLGTMIEQRKRMGT